MVNKIENSQLQQMFKSCPIGILSLDGHGHVNWFNEALSLMLGTRGEQLHDKTTAEVTQDLQPLFQSDSMIHIPSDGMQKDLWLINTTQQLGDDAGQIHYYVDITSLHNVIEERNQLKAELNDITMVDTETGMRNRKGLYYSFEPQLSRSRRYNRPLSIIIMRLDCIDDFMAQHQLDHALPLLQGVSHMLNDQLRWADIVGRLSETDFLMVLPETQFEEVSKVITNLRYHLTQIIMPGMEDRTYTVTAKFGAAEWRKGDDMGLLMMRARQMLDANEPAAAIVN